MTASVRGTLARLAGRGPTPRPPVEGLPPGLDGALLEALCRRVRGAPPDGVSHLNLSPFKDASGAYRIWCRLPDNRQWSVVFKDSRYDHFDAPQLGALPATVGPAEYAIYATADGSLRDLLPAVYHCAELSPRRHYQYLLEDLGGAYGKPTTPGALLRATAALATVSDALAVWSERAKPEGLIGYDHAYCLALADYAEATLDRYLTAHPDPETSARWASRAAVRAALTDPGFHDMVTPTGVHGDYNRASVLLGGSTGVPVRVIDWEWAGVGVPHGDLAALLARADDRLVQRALQVFARTRPELEPSGHARLFFWARALTGVKNAAFLAAQVLDGRTVTRTDRARYLARELAVAVDAAQRL